MDTIQVETDIHCDNCVSKLTPHLDNDHKIKNWSVDLGGMVKMLTVTGDGISQNYIDSTIHNQTRFHGAILKTGKELHLTH